MIRAMEQPTEQLVPPETGAPPRGVGGWLLFFILSITVLTPAIHGFILYQEWTQYNAEASPHLLNLVAVDSSMRTVLIVFGIYAGIQLFRLKPDAPRIAKTYLKAIVVQQIVLVLVESWTLTKLHVDPKTIGDVIIHAVRPLAYVAIWYAYLSRSRRVAVTYPGLQTLRGIEP